jgi:hypothetical protein
MAAIVWWSASMPSPRHVSALRALVLASAVAGCAAVPAPPVTVVARNVEFVSEPIRLPAGAGFHLTFDNRDDGIPHGLTLQTRTSGVLPTQLWAAEIVIGPSVTEYDLPGLAAGPYLLSCPVHPNMQLEVDGP